MKQFRLLWCIFFAGITFIMLFPSSPVASAIISNLTKVRHAGLFIGDEGLNYYFGNLHSHHYGTEGGDDGGKNVTTDIREPHLNGTFAYTYAFNHGLDFLALTPHVQNPEYVRFSEKEYRDLKRMADDFNRLHRDFVALAGYQWGTQSSGGHIIVLESGERCPVRNGDFTALYSWLNATSAPVAFFAHMYNKSNFNHGAYDPIGATRVMLFEIANGPAFSKKEDESDVPCTYEDKYIFMLNKGWKIGVVADQDNHYATWGASTAARTVVLAPALTRDNVLTALKARLCYASLDKNARLFFETSNGFRMGEIFQSRQQLNITFRVTLSDPDGHDSFREIRLYRDGVPVQRSYISGNRTVWTSSIEAADTAHYWFVKVIQNDGDVMWSSPIWSEPGTGDTTPPEILAFSPPNGTVGVALNPLITITFSEPMNPQTTKNAFHITPFVDGTFSWSPDQNVMYWSPNTLLSKNSRYEVTVDQHATDMAGNPLTRKYLFYFVTTGENDTTPPTILLTSPRDNEMNVRTDSEIEIRWSEVMNTTSVERSITIFPETKIHSFLWLGKTVLRIKFVSRLRPGTKYMVIITTEAKDLAGNRLQNEYKFSFSTENLGTISGFVKETDGTPVSAANISAYFETNRSLVASVFSSANGSYTISGLLPGSYVLVASSPQHRLSPEVLIELAPGEHRYNVNFSLERKYTNEQDDSLAFWKKIDIKMCLLILFSVLLLLLIAWHYSMKRRRH